MKKWIWLLSLFRSWCSSVFTVLLTRYHGNFGMTSMDAIKRDRTNLFWSEWEAVTERTRNLLKRHTGHCIMLTVDPLALSYAERQYKYQHKRKAADRANSQDRHKVENWERFPPLIIP